MNSEYLTKNISLSNTAIYDCYPGGNPTYIVYDPKIPSFSYALLGKRLMEKYKHFEQGGFLEPSRTGKAVLRLQMSANEFCGNAARSAAALLIQDYQSVRSFEPISRE